MISLKSNSNFNFKRLAISILLPQLASILGSFFTVSSVSTWYSSLNKPNFNPPNWIFGPVWTVLYILMGVSLYLAWQEIDKNKKSKSALYLFWIHLFFNATWSIAFFGLQNPALAFVNIIILWLLIVILIFKFWKINKLASLLLLPYLLWVSFASVLNYFIWYLN